MRILLIKTSSLGDVFHTLPALTDACQAIPGLRVDWVVEEAFAQIPGWHPAVEQVIPIAWRRWRKNLSNPQTRTEMRRFYHTLRATRYDAVIDAQGLIKSALVSRLARGPRYGLDRQSAREPLASLAYQQRVHVAKGQHAIHRLRQLFAQCLGYTAPTGAIDYGVDAQHWPSPDIKAPYVVFLHGSTWDTKLWPEIYWQQLRDLAIAAGYGVVLPWGNDEEQARAQRLAHGVAQAQVFEKAPLTEVAQLLCHAGAVIGVDTGLSHVAAALDIPTVAIYGATNAALTGVLGPRVQLLSVDFHCAPCLSKQCLIARDEQAVYPPCYATLTPQTVWATATQQISEAPR